MILLFGKGDGNVSFCQGLGLRILASWVSLSSTFILYTHKKHEHLTRIYNFKNYPV